ncbi:hypothetical protein Ancab_032100 [Ancistrocladus abbreviatus]
MDIKTFTFLAWTLSLFPLQSHSQSIEIKLDNSTDQQSLLAFKSYITYDPQSVLESWNSTTPFCSWKGVTCNLIKQRVTALNLENLGLVGTIAPLIGNLSFLRSLSLQNNSFSGKIPPEIGRLFRLKSLVLGSNSLEGSIPASIGLCSKLTLLDLSSNSLGGTIPPEIGKLSKLDALTFTDNYLFGQIPPSFGNLSSLTNLILLRNNLTGTLPESLGHLQFLVNIQVGLNYLDGDIPPSIFNRSSLIQLAVAGNKLSGTLPPDMFSKLPNLTILYMGGNQLSGPLPTSVGNASKLVRADFSSNNFSGQIPLLQNLPNIQILNLEINQLTNEGARGWDFLVSLSNSTQLQVFSLATNMLTGNIPSSIGNLSRRLSLLVMGQNFIEGSLPAEISNLVNLTMLSMEYNSLSGRIPASIGTLPILQNLHLHQNNFSGWIPASLGNLSALSEMTLAGNSIIGPIPSSLGNLQHLQVLDLSANSLKGTIPIGIFNIQSFAKLLNLSFNDLSGDIPQEIGNLNMIQAIDLSSNHFSGHIPASLGDCSSLWYLNMSRNSFQGSIPSSLSSMKGIVYIDLSYNHLSGAIPSSLESLKYLQFLDLSLNELQGMVPTEGIFTNSTAILLNGNHGLCGGILQLHLPICDFASNVPKNSHGSKKKLVIGIVASLTATILILLVVSLLLWRKKRGPNLTVNAEHGNEDDVIQREGQHRVYSYDDIKSATGDFRAENLIGEGSFGSVYTAEFRDGSVVAIKVFHMEQHGASKSFLAECEALRYVRHRNLVRIMSVCSSNDFKALILPYMPNGSLEQWLHKTEEERLDVRQRLEIARDVAAGLEYLHHDCETPVVHCDLKPSNVLLDEEMCAHVGDFGIARILSNSNKWTYSSTLGLKGSIGYIAPEYGVGRGVSTKGDVYSYGILLLEMFTGKRPTDDAFTEEMELQRWVSKRLLADRVVEIVDHKLLRSGWKSEFDGSMIAIFNIGLRCAGKCPEDRPTMREVSMLVNNFAAEFSNVG